MDAAVGSSFVQIAGIACVLGPPAAAMVATIPVLGLVARATGTRLSVLYALNTAGACAGVLVASFVLLPYLGVEVSAVATACLDLLVAALAMIARASVAPPPEEGEAAPVETLGAARIAVVASGFLTFALEVVWFRALRGAFLATTHGFAVMLASVLLALACGARLAEWLDTRRISLGTTLAAAGAAVIVASPLLERFDRLAAATSHPAVWFLATLAVCGPGMLLLGTCLPWVLDRHVDPAKWGRAYARTRSRPSPDRGSSCRCSDSCILHGSSAQPPR